VAKKKATHGGAREGAGRPAVFGPRVRRMIWMDSELAEQLESWRAQRGLSQSQAIDMAVRLLVKQRRTKQ
jgi:hypothetical protein